MRQRPSTKGSGNPAVERTRRGGLRALSTTVQQVTKASLGTRTLAEASLLAEWPAVVGAEFARACQPRRLSFPRRGERREGTLILRVKSGEATRIAHLEPVLVERVNGFFGYKAVARLRLEQGPLQQAQAPKRRTARPLDAAETQEIESRVAGVGDGDLRAALERLGRTLKSHAKE